MEDFTYTVGKGKNLTSKTRFKSLQMQQSQRVDPKWLFLCHLTGFGISPL